MVAYVIKTAGNKYWNGGKTENCVHAMESDTLDDAKFFKTDEEANKVFESVKFFLGECEIKAVNIEEVDYES